MNKKILKIDKTGIWCALSLIPILKMGSFAVLFPTIDIIFDILKIADLIILAMAFLIRVKHDNRIVIDRILVLTFLYSFHVIFVTWIYGGSIRYAIIHCAGLFLMYFWVFLFFGNRRPNLKYTVWLLTIIMIIDLITKLLYPDGLFVSYSTVSGKWMSNQNWFLGYKNNYFPIIGFTFLVLNVMIQNQKIHPLRVILIYALCLVEVLYVSKSASAIVATCLIILYFCIRRFKVMHSKRIIVLYFVVNALFLMLFVIPSGGRDVFIEIGNVFGKYNSILARFSLWNQAIDGIMMSPIWGLGFSSGNPMHPLANWNAHNRYLWSLVTVGIVGSMTLMALIVNIAKRIYRNYISDFSHFLGWIIFVILVVWQVETYENVAIFVYGMLMLVYYSCPIKSVHVSDKTKK